MQEPSLQEFDLTEELIQSARQSREKEERISRFLCICWVLGWITLGFACGVVNASENPGLVHWTVFGIIFGIFSVGPMAACLLPMLMSRCFPFHCFYSPILDRYSKFQNAQNKCENWKGDEKERERIRIWREAEAIKKSRAEYWFALGGHSFEHELAKLLRKLGWHTTVTPGSDDKGIDIFVVRDGLRLGVQCKAHRNPVGPSIVRELVGASVAAKCDGAILVALGGITSGARDFALQQSVEVWTINDVLKMQTDVDNNLPNEIGEGGESDDPF